MDFSSSGKLNCRDKSPPDSLHVNWFLEVDPGLSEYYRRQIPFFTQRQRYDPHITILRNEDYSIFDLGSWYDKPRVFDFKYSHHLYWNDTYVWLAVECEQAEEFRMVLQLPPFSPVTQSPTQEHKFHITLGNRKHLYVENDSRNGLRLRA